MAPLPVPHALTLPLDADQLDNEVVANRAALVAAIPALNTAVADLTGLTARVTALEAQSPATSPTPVVTVTITAAQETALSGVAIGSAAILRGPTVDIVLVRQ